VSGFNSRCGTFISVCDQPPRSTQPGHSFVGRCSEYQPKGGDALRVGSKGRYGSCVGWQVKLCDPLVTHRPYLTASEIKAYNKALYKFICLLYFALQVAIKFLQYDIICGNFKCIKKPTKRAGLVEHSVHTNPAVEQNRNVIRLIRPWNQSGIYEKKVKKGRKHLSRSQVLIKLRMKD